MFCVFDRISRRYLSWRFGLVGGVGCLTPQWVESWELASTWASEVQANRSAADAMALDPTVPDAHVEQLVSADGATCAVSPWKGVQS